MPRRLKRRIFLWISWLSEWVVIYLSDFKMPFKVLMIQNAVLHKTWLGSVKPNKYKDFYGNVEQRPIAK